MNFDIAENVMEEVLYVCGWDELDVWGLFEADLNKRSDPDFLRIIEKYGGKAFKKTDASYKCYQIIEIDCLEEEKDDYFIDEVENGFETIGNLYELVEPKTIKRIHGEI